MGFNRRAMQGLAAGGVFFCGLAAAIAGDLHLYATVSVAILAALFLAGLLLRQSPVRGRAGGTRVPQGSSLAGYRAQGLLDQTPSALILQEDDGDVLAVNRAARHLFDTPGPLTRSTRQALLAHGGGGLDQMPGRIKWHDRTYAVELCLIEEGGGRAHLAVFTDITAEVRAAEAAALRDLLQVLNHELMNALTPVASLGRSALDLMELGTDAAQDQAKRALVRVVARTEGLIDFVEAYRALTRLPEPRRRPVDLAAFTDDLAAAFAAEWGPQGVSLEAIVPTPNPVVAMDGDQIQLCLVNLLKNAAEATLDSREKRVRLHWQLDGDRVVFTVEDSGPGIDPSAVPSIFLPFYTTKANGSGVGLSLARQILQAHGGTLDLLRDAEPAPNPLTGACFRGVLRRV